MDNQTIDTYNNKAKEYDDETIDFWEQFPRTFLNTFTKLSGNKILNVGSGPGRDGLLLQEEYKEVTCLDASEVMIKLSTERGLNSILSSFNDIPFDNGSFDGVWSYTSLLHIPKKDVDTPLKEIARVLTPSGYFALGLIEGDTEEYRKSFDIDAVRLFSFYSKDETVELSKKHGFELVHFETFKLGSKTFLNFIFKKV